MEGKFHDITEGIKNRFAECPLWKNPSLDRNMKGSFEDLPDLDMEQTGPDLIDQADISYAGAETSDNADVHEKTPIQNKLDGLEREKEVKKELEEKYPESEGYTILSEVYLRDKDGNIVKDPETGEARRIDFVVVKDGKVVDSIEVTSKTADKTAQSAKEERIREAGGNYVKDSEGKLIEIPKDVETHIERRD